MGTLFDQMPRANKDPFVSLFDVQCLIDDICKLSSDNYIKIEHIIEIYKVLEMRRQNTLYVHNGDAFDEQMSGFGEILQQIVSLLTSKQ